VQLELSGGDTELDRSLLEAVKDPLTHLVRNAVDHGIEASADRVAAGKAPKGVLGLRAYHASGQVVVEVADDGRGIDPEKIGAKAVQKGLRTADQVAAMGQADLLQLLFLPGFSTAEVVSNVSGRGVGMDVVRTKIEAIGGAVEVDSVVGRGTTWRLRIPLTLAIMPALTVECSGDLYAIPQVNLLELVALDSQRSESGIEHIHEAAVYRLRGELLPLVSLSEVLEVGGERPENAVIAVVQSDQQRFGLLVDRVLNTEEIVVKPLSARLKAIGAYSGATVLGDGHVALILDVQAIARRALAGELDVAARDAHDNAAANAIRDTQQVLVVGIGGGRQVAMPLASVARLEHVQADQVEYVGGREVVQYRGTILPLARLDRILGAYGSEESSELLLVVYSRAGRSVGLVVKEIVDIVDDDSARHSDIEDAGLVGSTVLGDRVTELLDVRRAILAADPAFYDERAELRSTYDDLPTQVGGPELVGATR
jgi:two-component system chemotaxis sensor kinase CheA